jgi:hypothetical protein
VRRPSPNIQPEDVRIRVPKGRRYLVAGEGSIGEGRDDGMDVLTFNAAVK